MTRVVCPLCRTGFEANITRDNFALNCVACGVAFSAASFLSKEDFAKKGGGALNSTDDGTKSPVQRPAGQPAQKSEQAPSAPPTTRTGRLPFMAAPVPAPRSQPPAAQNAGRSGKPAANAPERKPLDDLRDRLKEIRAKLQEKMAQHEGSSPAPAPGTQEAEGQPAAPGKAAQKSAGEPVAAHAAPAAQPARSAGAPEDGPKGQDQRASPCPQAEAAKDASKSAAAKPKKNARPPLLEGSFGPYEIEGEIARGGVGAVFRARERTTGRLVALKVLLDGAESGEADRERFRHECETAKALSLPGMVQVYMVGECDGRPYMAMELVNGRSLDKIIPEKTLSVNDCLVLMKSVAETIGALHEAGYVHRDLKPGNILIDAFGCPKVADFGLIKSLDEITRLTASGLVCGTPAYMAPEQARGDGKAVDPRSDVWALGAVLYEMLTGQPPFQAENALRLMLRITKDQPKPPRLLNLKVPQDVHCMVMKCLEKNAANRYPHARALAEDISRFLNGEPLSAQTQPKMQRLIARAGQHRRTLVAAACGLAAVVVVAVLAHIVFAPREAAPLVERGYAVLGDRTLPEAARLSTAEKCFREAMVRDAKYGRAYLGLGLCLACQGIDRQAHRRVDERKVSEAMAATNQAAALDPQLRAECHAQVARLNMWLKQHVDEAHELEQAVEYSSGNLKYREALGMAYWNAGAQTGSSDYYKRAVREFQHIIRDDPSFPKVREYIRTLQERELVQAGGQGGITLNARPAHP
ncbi:MAG: protein kinase [Planctomycetota bacterium]|nr:protein kinase [Planctomycetota bacterium]